MRRMNTPNSNEAGKAKDVKKHRRLIKPIRTRISAAALPLMSALAVLHFTSQEIEERA